MGYDNDQDEIVLGELDEVTGPSDAEAEAAATEEIDDSQLSPEDGMRRRSAARREERDRKRTGGMSRAERREDRARKRARRKELGQSSPDLGRGKRIAAIVVALVLCVTLVGGGVYYFYFRGRHSGMQAARTGPDAGMDFGNITIVSASGTTSIGMSLETFELNLSDVDLTIDEVYVSNRDEVEEHQPILKINEESIEDARVKLQQTAQSAEYAYQLNEIDAQQSVITAKDTYEQALIALEYAEQDYADTVSAAQAEIDSLQRQVDAQQEKVDEYQAAVNDSEYYSKEYKVPEIKAQLEKDQALLQSIYDDDSTRVAEHLDFVYGGSYEAWLNDEEFDNSSSSSGGFSGGNGGGMPGMPNMTGGGSDGSSGGSDSGNSSDAANAGSSTGDTTSSDTSSTGSDTSSTGGESSGTSTSTDTTTGTDAVDASVTDGATTDTGTTSSDTATATQSTEETTQEVVNNETTEAGNEIRVYALAADDEEVTSETIENKVYYAEMPAGTSGSMPAATSSAAAGTTSTGSSPSSSASGSASITDEYTSSSVDTTKALSTSSLSNDDLTYFPWYSAYVALSEEVTEEQQEYEDAVTNAKRDQSRAASLLSQAQNRLESLQLKLRTAQNDLITTTEEAQETLDTVRAEATAAQETYNTSIRSIENTADTLKDAMETADENLEAFEEQIGDGYLYTSNAGTIMMVGVEEGDTLTYNAMIAAYTDPGTISVGAAVDQSNIASITVGDTVAVVFEEAGIYQGYVAAINPVTQSSSRTSVTYNVTVELEGDVSAVEENISATVYFGDAVPLVFEQAGDQLHSPDDASSTDADSTDSGSASSSAEEETSALESLIEQTDKDIENAESAAEAGTTAADGGDAAPAEDGSDAAAATSDAAAAVDPNTTQDIATGVAAVTDTTAVTGAAVADTAAAAGDTVADTTVTDTTTSEGQ